MGISSTLDIQYILHFFHNCLQKKRMRTFVRFVRSNFFSEIDRAVAIESVQTQSKSELSSQFFSRLEIFGSDWRFLRYKLSERQIGSWHYSQQINGSMILPNSSVATIRNVQEGGACSTSSSCALLQGNTHPNSSHEVIT